jgi:hypothetical protein
MVFYIVQPYASGAAAPRCPLRTSRIRVVNGKTAPGRTLNACRNTLAPSRTPPPQRQAQRPTASGSSIPVQRVSQLFVIEAADRWYIASQRLKWRWSKPVPMTVNAPVRVAVDRDKLYVIGEDEKEYELKIEKKGLTPTK